MIADRIPAMKASLLPGMASNRFRPGFRLVVIVALLACTGSTMIRKVPDGGSTIDKPRIIVTTGLGADPDDEPSLVRLPVSANEFDIEGLIVSTGCWKKDQSRRAMPDKIVDAYGMALPNLQVHATGYPSHACLKSISIPDQAGYGMDDVDEGTANLAAYRRLVIEVE